MGKSTATPTVTKVGEVPARGGSPYKWDKIAARLRRSPLDWHLVFEDDRTSYVVAIRAGGITALAPEKGFETQTRNNRRGTPRTCDLYVRYVPSKDRSK